MSSLTYSIIIPVYNSGQMLEELFMRIQKILPGDFEIIFVDDKSADNSWAILKKLKAENSSLVKIIRLTKNYGQHNATLCGLQHATGEMIITMDDDLQHPPEEIPKLISTQQEQHADLVYGVNPSGQPLLRRIPSSILKWFTKNILKRNNDWSAFRLMTKKLGDQLAKHEQGFFILDHSALSFTNKISFTKIESAKRKKGKSGYTLGKLLALWGQFVMLYLKLSLNQSSPKPTFVIEQKML